MNLRRFLLWLHRWAGVLAGLVVLVIAVTGALLVFPEALVRWRFPELFPQERSAERVPVGSMLQQLREKHPELIVQGMRLPRDDADALTLTSGNRTFHFDPHNGALLGSRPRADALMQTLIRLHVNLLLGPHGATIVVVATVITLLLALTGLWLWWPLRIFSIRRGSNFRRFNLDLHSTAGLYSSLFLLVIGITGITLRYWHGEHPRPPTARVNGQSSNSMITLDDAIRTAEKALPGARAAAVEMPGGNPAASYRIQLAFPEDGSPAGRSVVFVQRSTGEVLATHSSRAGSLGDQLQNNQLSIHTGAIGGLSTKIIALLTCVALVLQILSGYVLWWKRKSS